VDTLRCSANYYTAQEGTCRYRRSNVGATCTGYVQVPATELALQRAVAQVGPISVGINANLSSFQHYANGE